MAITTLEATNANWAASTLAIAILALRAFLTWNVGHVSKLSKYVCYLSILVAIARIPVAYFLLLYNAKTADLEEVNLFDPDLPRLTKYATSLTLTARCLATTYYWLQTSLLLLFYSRIVDHITWAHKAINLTWIIFVTTYLAIIIATLVECRPISLYWQINPEPQCARAYIQIFMQGCLNIVLDVMLFIIAIPIVARRRLYWTQLIQIGSLIAIGGFCIIVTGLKLAFVVGSASSQDARTFWASIQILVSTFVANAPTIYGCVVLRKRQVPSSLPNYFSGRQTGYNHTVVSRDHSRTELREMTLDHPNFIHVRKEVVIERDSDEQTFFGQAPSSSISGVSRSQSLRDEEANISPVVIHKRLSDDVP